MILWTTITSVVHDAEVKLRISVSLIRRKSQMPSCLGEVRLASTTLDVRHREAKLRVGVAFSSSLVCLGVRHAQSSTEKWLLNFENKRRRIAETEIPPTPRVLLGPEGLTSSVQFVVLLDPAFSSGSLSSSRRRHRMMLFIRTEHV